MVILTEGPALRMTQRLRLPLIRDYQNNLSETIAAYETHAFNTPSCPVTSQQNCLFQGLGPTNVARSGAERRQGDIIRGERWKEPDAQHPECFHVQAQGLRRDLGRVWLRRQRQEGTGRVREESSCIDILKKKNNFLKRKPKVYFQSLKWKGLDSSKTKMGLGRIRRQSAVKSILGLLLANLNYAMRRNRSPKHHRAGEGSGHGVGLEYCAGQAGERLVPKGRFPPEESWDSKHAEPLVQTGQTAAWHRGL